MPPAVGSALMGRFRDTSPIGFFESEKNRQRDANSKDLLVFHSTFIRCNNYVSLLPPRGTEKISPFDILTRLEKGRSRTNKQTSAGKSCNSYAPDDYRLRETNLQKIATQEPTKPPRIRSQRHTYAPRQISAEFR
jgi:hypothetical protein